MFSSHECHSRDTVSLQCFCWGEEDGGSERTGNPKYEFHMYVYGLISFKLIMLVVVVRLDGSQWHEVANAFASVSNVKTMTAKKYGNNMVDMHRLSVCPSRALCRSLYWSSRGIIPITAMRFHFSFIVFSSFFFWLSTVFLPQENRRIVVVFRMFSFILYVIPVLLLCCLVSSPPPHPFPSSSPLFDFCGILSALYVCGIPSTFTQHLTFLMFSMLDLFALIWLRQEVCSVVSFLVALFLLVYPTSMFSQRDYTAVCSLLLSG